jgi:hypothetical protein
MLKSRIAPPRSPKGGALRASLVSTLRPGPMGPLVSEGACQHFSHLVYAQCVVTDNQCLQKTQRNPGPHAVGGVRGDGLGTMGSFGSRREPSQRST